MPPVCIAPRENQTENYVLERDGIKIYLAKEFGFCCRGSIDLAYSAVESLGGDETRKLHITNELIHNPANDALHDKNVNFVRGRRVRRDLGHLRGDVVMLPVRRDARGDPALREGGVTSSARRPWSPRCGTRCTSTR